MNKNTDIISFTEQKDLWFDHFDGSSMEQRYDMYMELLGQGVSDDELISEDFGGLAVDLKSDLIYHKQYEKAVELIEKTKTATTTFYQKDFPYLADFAVEYYLFKQNFSKMRDHLQPYMDNPGYGYDMFIPLFDKIRYYQMDGYALGLAQNLFNPVSANDELITGAEVDLLDMIFYDTLQKLFKDLEQGIDSIDQAKETLKKYDYNDVFFEQEFPLILQCLTDIAANDEPLKVFSPDKWHEAVRKDKPSAVRQLFWAFAGSMLKRGNFHFSISADLWYPFMDMLYKEDLLESLNFSYKDLEKLITEFFSFLSEKEESGFALAWGIPYIYDFLLEQELVSEQTHNNALVHTASIKNKLLTRNHDDSWRFDFVHKWEKPLSITDESFAKEQEQFQESFVSPLSKKAKPTKTNDNQFDSFFGNTKDTSATRPKTSKTKNKNKRKNASKQRKKNRKKK